MEIAEIVADPTMTTEQKIDEIWQFCAKLSVMLDQMSSNPMLAAFM